MMGLKQLIEGYRTVHKMLFPDLTKEINRAFNYSDIFRD